MLGETLHAAQTFCTNKNFETLKKSPRVVEVAFENRRDHAAESVHLFFRERVLRVRREAGIKNFLHFWMRR